MKKLLIILSIFLFISCKSIDYTWNEQLYDIKYLPVTKQEGLFLIERFKANCYYPYQLQKIRMLDLGYVYKYYIIIDKNCRYATQKILFWKRQILRNKHYKKLLDNI